MPQPAFDLLQPERIVTLAPLTSRLTCVSVHRRFEDWDRHFDGEAPVFAYALWLESPAAREVELSTSPGNHWLNGVKLQARDGAGRILEHCNPAKLRPGWNLLYGEVRIRARCWGTIVGWPRTLGVRASARPDATHCGAHFLISGCMPEPMLHRLRREPPADAEGLARLSDVLALASEVGATAFPSRHVAWDEIKPTSVADPSYHHDIEVPRGPGGEGIVVFDFGREFIGHVGLDIDAPAGGVVDVANEELLRGDGSVRMFARNAQVNPVDRLHLRAGRNQWEGFHARGGRYIQVTVRAPGPVMLRRVSIRSALVSVPPSGSFECSDPVLNWAWNAGVATLKASLTDGWVDPFREQGLYIGDALVEYLAHRAWTRDRSHIVRALRMWARAQMPDGQLQVVVPSPLYRPHPDYTLLWILILRDYALHTGDHALVRELRPVVDRIWHSSSWRPGPDGLWNSDDLNVFGDWGATRDATEGDANGILNAFRVGALEASAQLMELCGEIGRARSFRTERERVAAAYREALWDSTTNAFAPCLRSGKPVPTSAAHANALALLYRIAAPEQEPGALALVRRHLAEAMAAPEKCMPRGGHFELYFLHFVLEMLGDRGLYSEAEAVIRFFWGLQRDRGAWTLWEAFHRGLAGVESQCHGWSAGPNVYFHRTVLGLDSTAHRVTIIPGAAGLTHAKGVHPHPSGDIAIAWRVDGRDFYLEVELPEKLPYDVRPGRAFAHLRPHVRVHTRSEKRR